MSDRRARFMEAFDAIRDELLAHFAHENMPEDAQAWYKRVRLRVSPAKIYSSILFDHGIMTGR